MLAAPRRGGIVVGYWLTGVARAVFTILVVTTVALVTGMSVGGGGIDLVGLYVLALLVNAAATLFGSGVAMRLRTMQAGPAMQVPVFLFLFLAPVWLPYDLLTGWVHAAATLQPGHAVPRDRAGVHRRRPHARAAGVRPGRGPGRRGRCSGRAAGLRSAERAA